MFVVAMFWYKGRLEMKLVHRNFLDENVPAAQKFLPCNETVQMGDHRINVRETHEVRLLEQGITKIEGLDNAWMFIERIYLNGNQIVTIEGLNRCKNLGSLNLARNRITKIDDGAFDGLVNLEELYLGLNQIKKIENLEPLVQLKQLELHHNNIKKIEGLGELTSLKQLGLDNNQICDTADLIYLGETLKKLEEL